MAPNASEGAQSTLKPLTHASTRTQVATAVSTMITDDPPHVPAVPFMEAPVSRCMPPETAAGALQMSLADVEGQQGMEKPDTADVLLLDLALKPLITIPILVGADRIDAVLDTGSQISIINSEAVERLRRKPKDMATRMRLMMANGTTSEARQSTTMPVQVGNKDFEVDFVVVPSFPNLMLLGLDFILRSDVRIVPAEKEIWVNGNRFELPEASRSHRSPGLATAFNVTVPARREIVLDLSTDADISEGSLMLCEGADAPAALGLLVAASVSFAKGGRMQVRVANPTSKDIKLPPGMVIAQAEPVEEVIEARSFSVLSDSTSAGAPLTSADKPSTAPGPALRPFPEGELDIGETLTTEQRRRLFRLLDLFPDIMSTHESDTGLTDLVVHQIHTGDAAPINSRPYRLSFAERREVSKLVEEYLAAGFIQESDSPWACPIVLVRKKDGTLRFCCDWRKLNGCTRRDAMPLPRIDDMIDRLAKARFFTKLDFTSGYYQVALAEGAREKTAFVTPDGHYEWLVMGMGLTNAPATFQRLMYKVLGGLLWTNSMAYLDDIVVFSGSFDQHLLDLAAVFERIRSAKLKIKPPKCSFAKTGIHYLGFVITPDGIECDPANTAKVLQFPLPKDKTDVRSFLGLTSYYRKFIKDYAFIARPLHDLTRDGVEFLWTEGHRSAFEALRSALVSPPILAFPNFDRPFIVSTDASGFGIGCILKQTDDAGRERVVAYASRVLTEVERRYSVTERECLALRYATQVFRPYLHGAKFKVVTDHRSLLQMKTLKNPTNRLNRFSMDLEGFDYDIEFKEGRKHSDADALSRYGLRSSAEGVEAGRRILEALASDSDDRQIPSADDTQTNCVAGKEITASKESTTEQRMKSIIRRSTDRGKAQPTGIDGHPRIEMSAFYPNGEPRPGPSGLCGLSRGAEPVPFRESTTAKSSVAESPRRPLEVTEASMEQLVIELNAPEGCPVRLEDGTGRSSLDLRAELDDRRDVRRRDSEKPALIRDASTTVVKVVPGVAKGRRRTSVQDGTVVVTVGPTPLIHLQ